MTDYNALRAQTIGSAQEEEAVTVNTRALIDKVLARYSSENTTLRELLQNAADANATSVEVRYDSVNNSSQPIHQELDVQDLVKQKMRRVLVKNNGHPFREEDWQRLKRIAEGNPDETKIGAFGVGFYSVFSDCEEPFVSSGNETMIFYWKENTLVTRRHKLKESDPYTTFLLEYREPAELPDLKELCKFFATSLTFVKLNTISLYVNDRCLLQLTKKTSPSEPLAIPNSINPTTSERLMKISAVETERLQIDAKYMNITHYRAPTVDIANGLRSIFSRFSAAAQSTSTAKETSSSNLMEYTQATIFLRIATAAVTTSVSSAFARELERATKKPPPRTTRIAILSMSKDELDASEHKAEIFSNVLPSKAGKIFIGFPTHQTTSISAHISAPSVIPTVERENIDLNARVVKEWNIEMLRISGILARIIYTDEMTMLGQRASGLKPENLVNLYDHAIHIMRQFTFSQSTPSSAVGRYIESEFWNCSKKDSIELFSTKGVLSSDKVRVASDVNFLEGMPLLPEKLEKEASVLVGQLKAMGLLTEITISDIRGELGDKALSGDQLGLFLNWLAGKRLKDELDIVGVKSLLEVAVATTAVADYKGESFGIPISLGTVKFYINAQKLSADIPVPPDCLPFNVTKSLTKPQLDALGWEELGVSYWLQYICARASALPVEQNIQLSAKFAHTVLAIISKGWEQLPPGSKEIVITLLKDRTCVPTRQGMKIPREAYFNTVKLFSDLPLVESMHGVRDKLLVALGVRKTVDLKLVFERLMNGSQAGGAVKWSHVDLIRYLTSVRDDIPREDITKLKNTAICKAEGTGATDLYKVSELYEPNDSLRKLQLPILQWPGIWREGSNEAKFLSHLGLKRYPGVQQVLEIAGNRTDVALREAALSYFIINYHTNSYHNFNTAGATIPFLPLEDSKGEKGPRLVTPWQCFSNPKAAIMGFDILRQDLQQHGSKFGVKPDPDMKDCVDELIKSPPTTTRAAREKFGYFSTRLADIMPHLAERLSQARIIPVPLKDRERIPSSDLKIKHITPRTCFLGGTGSQYFEIFDFVDFGQEANSFLLKCGSKHEPTVAEVTYMMVREPQRLYGVFNSSDKYLSVLRSIAESWAHLRKDKVLVKEMRRSPFLGSFRWRSYTNEKSGQMDLASLDEDDVGGIREFVLARVDEVLISDDYVLFLLFRGEILAAPQEDALEGFYQALGVQRLSSKVSTDWNIGHVRPMPEKTEKLRKLVLERSRLFLHNNTEEVLHDARWLENNLKVEIVDSIRLRRTLRNEGSKALTHQDTKTATITMDTRTKWWVLYLTPKFEYYDVSQALVTLILRKPRPHSSLLLDSLLHNDLMTLKSRGYNVDRILRAKAAEARMAEEQRLKQAEIERKALEEQEKRYQQSQMQLQQGTITRQIEQKRVEEEKLGMPGAFGESPQAQTKAIYPPAQNNAPDRLKNNFFGRISKHLGFDANGQAEQMQNLFGDNNPQHRTKSLGQPGSAPTLGESKPDIGKATEPHRIQTNLQRAISASRGHNSDSVFSPPQTFEVKEAPSYCDNHSGQDILYFAETPNGIKVFIDRKIVDKAALGQKYVKELNEFSNVLKELSEIFGLSITSLHIFYDEVGNTIAFNTNGSLFCNLRFYLQLHAKDVAIGDHSQALIYWFVVLCHELAHNLVQVHDEKHSFYTETFVQEYFIKIMTKLKSIPGAKPWDINI